MAQYRVIYSAGGVNSVVTGTVDEITAAMRGRFPELGSVTPTVDGETVIFTVRTGSKAAQYRVVYSAGGIDNVVTGSVEDITSAMRSRFPELASVAPTVDGETVTFTVRTGSKAA